MRCHRMKSQSHRIPISNFHVISDMSRSIRYFVLIIVFCAVHGCVSSQTWSRRVQAIIDRTRNVEPYQRMKVDVRSIFFEETGRVVESNAQKSLTFIAYEYFVEREPDSSDEDQSHTRVYYQFKIESTNSDSTTESISTFWTMDIKKFLYFAITGGKMTLRLTHENNIAVHTVNFLHPEDAQLFWHYASKMRVRKKIRVIDLLRFQIFNRRTKEKLKESSFAVIHKERSANVSATYIVSSEIDGRDGRNLLMIFASGNYTVSKMVEDRVGLLVSGEPDLVFVLQFPPFETDAADEFRDEIFRQRSRSLSYLSYEELKMFIRKYP